MGLLWALLSLWYDTQECNDRLAGGRKTYFGDAHVTGVPK